MLDRDTSLNLVNVNSKDDKDYDVHCQSKIIEHPVFWLFLFDHKKCSHCKYLNIQQK